MSANITKLEAFNTPMYCQHLIAGYLREFCSKHKLSRDISKDLQQFINDLILFSYAWKWIISTREHTSITVSKHNTEFKSSDVGNWRSCWTESVIRTENMKYLEWEIEALGGKDNIRSVMFGFDNEEDSSHLGHSLFSSRGPLIHCYKDSKGIKMYGSESGTYPFPNNDIFKVNDRIKIAIDVTKKEVSCYYNDQFVAVIAKDLQLKTIRPMLSMHQKCHFKLTKYECH